MPWHCDRAYRCMVLSGFCVWFPMNQAGAFGNAYGVLLKVDIRPEERNSFAAS